MTYSAKTISKGITLIRGLSVDCCMYLVEGTCYALLIDTGTGTENIADYASSLTALPVKAINTHGHGDHSGGNIYFREVMMHEKAEPDSRNAIELNKNMLSPEKTASICAIAKEKSFCSVFVHDGDCIDLGGRILKVIEIPGHTPGCIALHDSLSGLLFSGDCLLKAMDILLVVPQALSVREYLASMKKLALGKEKIAGLLTGHDEGIMPVAFLEDSVICCEKLLTGDLTGDDIELPPVFGETHAKRAAYGTISIAYRPEKLNQK